MTLQKEFKDQTSACVIGDIMCVVLINHSMIRPAMCEEQAKVLRNTTTLNIRRRLPLECYPHKTTCSWVLSYFST